MVKTNVLDDDSEDNSPSEEIFHTRAKSSSINRHSEMLVRKRRSFGTLGKNTQLQREKIGMTLYGEQNKTLAQANENLRQIIDAKNTEILHYKQEIFELSEHKIGQNQKIMKLNQRIRQLEARLIALNGSATHDENSLERTFDSSVSETSRKCVSQMVGLIGDINEFTKSFPSLMEKMYLLNQLAGNYMGINNQSSGTINNTTYVQSEQENYEQDMGEDQNEEYKSEYNEEQDEGDPAENDQDDEQTEGGLVKDNQRTNEDCIAEENGEYNEEDSQNDEHQEQIADDEEIDQEELQFSLEQKRDFNIQTAIYEQDEDEEEGEEEEIYQVEEELSTIIDKTQTIDNEERFEASLANAKKLRRSTRRVSFSNIIDTQLANGEPSQASGNTTYCIEQELPVVTLADENVKKIRRSIRRVSFSERVETQETCDEFSKPQVNTTYCVDETTQINEHANSSQIEEKNADESTHDGFESTLVSTNDITFDKPKTVLKKYDSRPILKKVNSSTHTANTTYNVQSNEIESTINACENVVTLQEEDNDKSQKPPPQQPQKSTILFEDSISDEEEEEKQEPKLSKNKSNKTKGNKKISPRSRASSSKAAKVKKEPEDDEIMPRNPSFASKRQPQRAKTKQEQDDEARTKLQNSTKSASKLDTKDDKSDEDKESIKKSIKSKNLSSALNTLTASKPQSQLNAIQVIEENKQKKHQIQAKNNGTVLIQDEIKVENISVEEVDTVKSKPPAPQKPPNAKKEVLKVKCEAQQKQETEPLKLKRSLSKSRKTSTNVDESTGDDSNENQDPSNTSENNTSVASSESENGRCRRARKKVFYKELTLNCKLRRDDDDSVLVKIGSKILNKL